MLKQDNKDYIYVIWKEPVSRRQFIIGELVKNGKYEFFYGHEVINAIEKGFDLLIEFDDLEKVYYCDELFPTFASRLPDKRRRGIEKILNKYGLNEFDKYELLKRSGAKLPTDNIEFIDPMPQEIENEMTRYFYIAGPRHYIGCNEGNNCEDSIDVKSTDKLYLELEPSNKYDKFAIQVINSNKEILGYIPRYYSENLSNFIKNGYKYDLMASLVNKNKNCNECIKVKLKVKKD